MGSTRLPFGHHPLMLYNGEVSCQTLTGKISIMRLGTHNFSDDQEITTEQVCLIRQIIICTWKSALVIFICTAESFNDQVSQSQKVISSLIKFLPMLLCTHKRCVDLKMHARLPLLLTSLKYGHSWPRLLSNIWMLILVRENHSDCDNIWNCRDQINHC